MPKITPFKAIRPIKSLASQIAALPYDVYNRQEATEIVKKEPLSFLKIDRAETNFPADLDTYDEKVYLRAKEILAEMTNEGTFIKEDNDCYYIYELTMNEHTQTGIVACSAISDYQNNHIKKHENTRPEKEIDRIRHIDTVDAHTGPIFMAYRSNNAINEIVLAVKKAPPEYDFTSSDDVSHRVWVINQKEMIDNLHKSFLSIPAIYIADGHHRCASAVKVGLKRKDENPAHTGDEEYNRFLTVLFPDDQLKILPYYRAVTDLNGMDKVKFIAEIEKHGFTIKNNGNEAVNPKCKGEFGMYLDGCWYHLTVKPELLSDDPINGLDAAILQDNLLKPILGIDDPRTNKRIDFIGGIRGLSELERRVSLDMTVAFSVYATTIAELLSVADANLLMPPKSTWFEPKLRSGLFIHALK
ncbi:MAG: DUF1015 family protein [Lachnospiraceae bacterium]|nr:DUF1015 family protein [Lachnospiraceae bacterium]